MNLFVVLRVLVKLVLRSCCAVPNLILGSSLLYRPLSTWSRNASSLFEYGYYDQEFHSSAATRESWCVGMDENKHTYCHGAGRTGVRKCKKEKNNMSGPHHAPLYSGINEQLRRK